MGKPVSKPVGDRAKEDAEKKFREMTEAIKAKSKGKGKQLALPGPHLKL